jgi:hypothetical protein
MMNRRVDVMSNPCASEHEVDPSARQWLYREPTGNKRWRVSIASSPIEVTAGWQ